MRRILIIGCPGSGKSTFARSLGEGTGIPVIHLDMLYWNGDKTTVSPGEFQSRLNRALSGESWIIDGNYASTLGLRLKHCDTVFLLDIPTQVCLDGLQARMNIARPDMPWIETEYDADFIEFVRSFREKVLPGMLETLRQHPDKQIITLRSHAQMQSFLHGIKKESSI